MNRIFTILVFVTLAFVIGIAYLKNFNFYHDDAYISLKYAHNFVNDDGLVWNINEYVQGYTNFLLVLTLSLLSLLGIDLYSASRLVGISSYFVLAISSYFLFKPYKRLIDYIPFIIIASSFPIIVWSLSGLETVFYSLLLFISAILTLKNFTLNNKKLVFLSGLTHALTFLLRPEGVILIATTSLFLILNKSYKKVLIFTGSVSVIILPYFFWQFTYYNSIIPNSVIAKTFGIPKSSNLNGFKYLIDFIFEPPFLFFFIFGLLFYRMKNVKLNINFIYISTLILFFTSLIVYVGGDHMPAYRFFVPIIPLFAILNYIFLPLFKFSKMYEYSISILFLSSILFQTYSKKLNPINPDPPVKLGSFIATHIKDKWRPGALIAVNPAGTIPFLAKKYRYIDMLGLNDKVIAKRKINKTTLKWQTLPGHAKGNGTYVLDRKPDIIIAGPVNGSDPRINPWWLSDYEMAKDERFERNYVMRKEFIEERKGLYLKFTYFELRK